MNDISFDIHDMDLIFFQCGLKVLLEGSMSQISDSGPSFDFV